MQKLEELEDDHKQQTLSPDLTQQVMFFHGQSFIKFREFLIIDLEMHEIH